MTHGIGGRRSREENESVSDLRQHVSDENLTMTVRDSVVEVTITSTNSSTITLPSVSEATGGLFVVRLVAVGTGTVTIQDKSNDAGMGDITLASAGDYAVLYSTGVGWAPLSGAGTADLVIGDDLTITGDLAVDGGDIDAGASGAAGSVDVFPSTASSGKLIILCADQDGDTAVTLQAEAMGQATVVSVPDPGASTANILLTSAGNDGVVAAATAAEIDRKCDVSANAVSLTATAAITEALHEGKKLIVTGTDAAIYTLPEATGSGAVYEIVINEVNTSGNVIKTADTTDCGFYGSVNILDLDAAAQSAYAPASTDDLITLNGTTTGGAVGDWIRLIDMATDKWCVVGQLQCPTGSNPATPFSGT
jgi:hypothetical protein